MRNGILTFCLGGLLLVGMVGCARKVDQASYDKIQEGMTESEV